MNAGFCILIGRLSNTFCYLLNRLFVFKPGHHWIQICFSCGLRHQHGIGTAIRTFLITQSGSDDRLGANIICALFISYAMRKFVIFKADRPHYIRLSVSIDRQCDIGCRS